MSLSHLHLAQTMREEAKKLEDFKEKQKEARKRVRCTSSISYFVIYLLKVKCAISALPVSLNGKTFHTWRKLFVSVSIHLDGCCSFDTGPLGNMGVQFLALFFFFLPRCKSDHLLWCCKEITILMTQHEHAIPHEHFTISTILSCENKSCMQGRIYVASNKQCYYTKMKY